MPFLVPISIKVAITSGVIIGGTVAFLNNRERVLDAAAELLQKGADYCREKSRPIKAAYADSYEDGELAYATGSEATTPDITDVESETDCESFADIKEEDPALHWDELEQLYVDGALNGLVSDALSGLVSEELYVVEALAYQRSPKKLLN